MIAQTLINGISAGALFALVALGFAMIFESSGFFDLGQGGLYLLGFYVTFTLVDGLQLPVLLAAAVACVSMGLLGAGIHLIVYEKLTARVSGTVPLLIASLGVLSLLENLAALTWGADTKSVRTGIVADSFTIGEARITSIQLATLAVTFGMYLAVALARSLTPWGRGVRAVASDRELASIRGLRVSLITLGTVAIASGITTVAAIMSSLDTDMSPAAAFPAVLIAWVATVLGGVGRTVNTLFAGLALGLLHHLPTLFIATTWQDSILYGFVLLILIIRPRGLAPIRTTVFGR